MTDSTNGTVISLDNVSRSFGATTVLSSLSLDIPAGQFVSIVGKSGCGKTTLLRLIAGLDEPTEGVIRLDGREQHGLNGTSKVMFQSPRLLPWKTVEENVRLGLDQNHAEAAERALEQVGLHEHRDLLPQHLSGGQAQRVALARALASSPKLLLLDEPLGALDALTRYSMQDLILEIWRKQRFTVVLITHDVTEAVYLSERVIMLRDHHIALDDPINLPYPRNRESQAFTQTSASILNAILHD